MGSEIEGGNWRETTWVAEGLGYSKQTPGKDSSQRASQGLQLGLGEQRLWKLVKLHCPGKSLAEEMLGKGVIPGGTWQQQLGLGTKNHAAMTCRELQTKAKTQKTPKQTNT